MLRLKELINALKFERIARRAPDPGCPSSLPRIPGWSNSTEPPRASIKLLVERQEADPMVIIPVVARDKLEAGQYISAGLDPVVMRLNEFEAVVYTRRRRVIANIREGGSWSSGIEAVNPGDYTEYVYTRLTIEQLCDHLVDPGRHRSSEE